MPYSDSLVAASPTSSKSMFSKPKQGSQILLDLQEIYNDVCTNAIKNHDLEATGRYEQARKGWKSLHNTLLYKIEIYEKINSRMSPEETDMVAELKAIRDENVKHLVRLLLMVDEHKGAVKKPPLGHSTPFQNPHKLSIPSLRLGPSDRTLSNNGLQRNRRTRANARKPPTSQSEIVQAAANISWGLLKSVQPPKPEPITFADIDQSEYPIASRDNLSIINLSYSSSDSAQSINLIDLNDDADVNLESSDRTLFNDSTESQFSAHPSSRLSAAFSKKMDPALSRVKSHDEPDARLPPATGMPNMSKLSPRISSRPGPSLCETFPPKKYSYVKPKPMNVHDIMKKTISRLEQRLNSFRPSAPSTARLSSLSSPSPSSMSSLRPQPSKNKNPNITYNYKPAEKPAEKPAGQDQRAKALKKKTALKLKSPSEKSSDQNSYLGGFYDEYNDEDGRDYEMSPENKAALVKSIKGVDETAANQILNDIIVRGDLVWWEDVVGLESAKASLKEAVVYPFLRPDLFRGLREPSRGMLLFGPPGTGKTMLARAVATESKSTFFSISSSSLTSKYLGESEKLVKALFLIARKLSPSIVFIDEIDSILGERMEGESDATRRIKNEFLILWSELSSAAAGRDTADGDLSRVLILGATNMPWAIDQAARRRFAKRVYIPLPERETRMMQIAKLLEFQNQSLLRSDFEALMDMTEGFSGSDITLLAKDSAMGPLRSLGDKLLSTPTEDIRPIMLQDFVESLKYIRPSVSQEGMVQYEAWASKFGSSGI